MPAVLISKLLFDSIRWLVASSFEKVYYSLLNLKQFKAVSKFTKAISGSACAFFIGKLFFFNQGQTILIFPAKCRVNQWLKLEIM